MQEAPAYRQAVVAGGYVYVSTIRPRDISEPTTIASQTADVFAQLKATLEAAGSSMGQLCSVNVSVRSASDFAAMNARAALGQNPIVTTEEVLTEFLAAMSGHPFLRISAKKLLESIFLSPYVSVIEQSHASFTEGLELYNNRPDKAYSLVDCISMTICRKSKITEVLTHDHHFRQEGFLLLIVHD